MDSSPMRQLWPLRKKTITTRSGRTFRTRVAGRRFGVYYAARRGFMHPGVHVWAFGRHWRVFPLPKRSDAQR